MDRAITMGGMRTPKEATQGTLGLAGFIQWSPVRYLWLGPRIGGVLRTDLVDREYGIDADVLGVVRWFPDSRLSPRLSFGIGVGWNTLEPPRSFAIEHELAGALGFHSFLGVGIERLFRQREMAWFLDLRADAHYGFQHSHMMRDTRTGETETELREFDGLAIIAVGGLMWNRGP